MPVASDSEAGGLPPARLRSVCRASEPEPLCTTAVVWQGRAPNFSSYGSIKAKQDNARHCAGQIVGTVKPAEPPAPWGLKAVDLTCARGYSSAADALDHAAEIWSKSCAPGSQGRRSTLVRRRPNLYARVFDRRPPAQAPGQAPAARRDSREASDFALGSASACAEELALSSSSTSSVPAAQALGHGCPDVPPSRARSWATRCCSGGHRPSHPERP